MQGANRSVPWGPEYTAEMTFFRVLAWSALSFAALSAAALAQSRDRLAAGFEDITAAKLRADLFFLSSDALEGRMSLERGDDVAIQWIASEYAKAGLKPLVGDSYLQPVPLIEYKMDRARTVLTLRTRGTVHEFRNPDFTGNYPNDGSWTGRVLFAGFGITAPELKYDDYAGIDAKGKIVLIFSHEPQEDDPDSIFNGKGNTRYANARAKMMIAQRHGAAAVLMMPDPNHKPGNQRGGLDAAGPGAQTLRTPPPIQAIDGEDSIPVFNVTAKVGEELLAAAGQKGVDLQTSIDKTLKPASLVLGDAVVEVRAATAQRKRGVSFNVAGMIEGSDPRLREETVLFSAHHDHNGARIDGEIYRGADDNGSGTVGIVSLARAYAKNTIKPKRSLVLVVFAAEERGLLGGYYYAAHPLRPLGSTVAQINFDMIGRDEKDSNQTHGLIDIAPDTSNEINIIGTRYSPDYRSAVVRSNEFVGLQLNYKWDDDTVLNVLFRSDQYPMLLHDIPAIWWFTGFHPDYHQITDTAEKIDYAKMEKIVRLAYLTGFDFGDTATPPKFLPTGSPK
jgi:hypothetical protein